MGAFTGLDPDAPAFFTELAANNTKAWWAEHKARYEERVRGPFAALGEELAVEFGPVKIFRPYRDVRFSADKSPYKVQIGLVSRASVAHYLQLSADGLLVGGGSFEVPPKALARFREIVDDPKLAGDLEATLEETAADGFSPMRDDALRTAPRGYSVDHPRIELLRLKHLAIGRSEPPADWMWTPDALDIVRDQWRTVSIWCDWLRENLGAEIAAGAGRRR
ncbi:DUF2461 domain-containing protein [Agromyces mangrovi Wang et al. 2018]|uniref:DUF2461 domain-containing protein n=1 Tax=Agromyces mangrovi TaxID=1858653 RepID=UPI002572A1A0|nr:DUF2461 domain-containing protein [Agromyces mangrovi]BDZ65527.1 TIGR02453 family protein [Agromyces mangrovi]